MLFELDPTVHVGRVWRYQRGNQNLQIEWLIALLSQISGDINITKSKWTIPSRNSTNLLDTKAPLPPFHSKFTCTFFRLTTRLSVSQISCDIYTSKFKWTISSRKSTKDTQALIPPYPPFFILSSLVLF